jgi:O-antigen/teichoic acid export membrane protein
LNPFKKLAGDTAIYGMSSIVGRFLNWWLVPYYSFIFVPEVYGVVTNLYSYVAFFLVLMLYGMETSFFRYASKSKDRELVYSTSLISVFFTSALFVMLITAFSSEIAELIHYPRHAEYIIWLGIILGIDAFTAIPFARLRLNNRPVKFAVVKVINIGFNIGFNIFFLSVCPGILEKNPASPVGMIYSADIGVGYVFISNLLASLVTLVLLMPEILRVSLKFNGELMRQMLSYGFPILIVGLAGMVNQNIDKILIPFLVPEDQNPMHQLGVYGANYKLAVLMNMFIQAFRYAFEPFFFARGNSKDDPLVYAVIMKYFVIFGLTIFLGMVLYIDIVTLIIGSNYHEGLKVVPIILMANLFFGIYFTLSLWYKLKDMTRYGAYIALTGSAITLVINFLLIPVMGYMGSAIAVFVCYFIMMVISYLLGRKYYPVPYNLKRIGTYFLLAALIYAISLFSSHLPQGIQYAVHTLLLMTFFYAVWMLEKFQLKRLFKKQRNSGI